MSKKGCWIQIQHPFFMKLEYPNSIKSKKGYVKL